MNSDSKSPLRDRIKILGKATEDGHLQFITQATFVSRLEEYLTDDPMRDRDQLKRGEKLPEVTPSVGEKLVFRELFRQKKDAEITRAVWNYFEAIAARWPEAWNSAERGDVLNRSTGFTGFMRFLGPVFREVGQNGKLPAQAVARVLQKIKLRDSDFNVDRFKPGTSGESSLFRELREQSGIG